MLYYNEVVHRNQYRNQRHLINMAVILMAIRVIAIRRVFYLSHCEKFALGLKTDGGLKGKTDFM
jgi:hypothetical protein